ncbi:DUF1642 domain-containing protein [Streptococcus suis]|uniref:DUF1642 domain-containing protein n=1 Tax=Streptococcus suis TaxID=1307 RepID=UPI000CF42AC2
MNKWELEKQAEALYTDVRSFLDNTFELIDQIHEPQKVVVPKLVALRIEKYKDSNKPLYQLLDLSDDKEFNDWFLPNGEVDASRCDVLARAWLDGYTIEQEKLYTVEIPNNGGTLILACTNHAIKLVDGNKHLPGKFTKESIEYAGFDWALKWAKPAEVE